ncbi:carboxy terminal-processing peptidase [Thermomonas sp.]|uniref:carboxy terminal-processing peptidase n=1 Tax=Thermomonas sp. TaxID=1971895 RepID=UPI002489D404|nr:carboxy terminal-processing peptidase [Thermomonas sp.]MDI1254040.1 carboxy terminal-processing peptidase [Thermomonas sp.]
MKPIRTLLAFSLGLALVAPLALLARNDNGPMLAVPTTDQATTSRLVYGLLSDSRYAYRPRALDDALSQDILKRYLEALDPGKVFFTAQDVAGFDQYKTRLDDAIKSGDVAPAWAMFAVYRQRMNERLTQARTLLKGNFDFTTDEQYQYDREDAPWAASKDVLDTLWRQSVKNDWLRLKLAGKKPDEIRKTLDKRYANVLDSVSELKGDDVFQSFMNAYASAIDPHTDYMNPRSAENFNLTMSNSLEGIGAVLQKQDDVVLIREIVPGGPASRSSLKPGDRITAVGQGASGEMKDIVGVRIDDAVQLIRGAADSQVRLDVISAEAPLDAKPERLVLTRAKVRLEDQAAKAETITVPASQGEPARKIGVIKLPGFYQDFDARRRGDENYASATRDVARLLAQFRAQKMDGVVLDLRNNGGGSLSEAVELTGLFIDQGPVVQVRESSGRVSVEDDRKPGVAWTGPLAVLVNRGSASASEIVAGAIQDYGRGLIIGETTFGKGTVQNMVDLDRWPANEKPRFGQVKLTIAQFFRPGGSSTQNKGVVPDVGFPISVDASEYGESKFDNALPWTRIAVAPHVQYGNFVSLLGKLDARHDARVAKDIEFQWFAEDVASFREQQAKKSVSLNEIARRTERDKFDALRKRRAEQRVFLGIELDPLLQPLSDDGLQDSERNVVQDAARDKAAKKRTDPLLRESAAILGDAIGLLGADAKLSAQVLPESHSAGHWVD